MSDILLPVLSYLLIFIPVFGQLDSTHTGSRGYVGYWFDGLMLHVKFFVISCVVAMHVMAYLLLNDAAVNL